MVSGMTVGLLKEILEKHNVSDDDTIDFHFSNSEKDESFDKDYPNCSREMEFEGIYKREFGVLIDFKPSIIEDDEEEECPEGYEDEEVA